MRGGESVPDFKALGVHSVLVCDSGVYICLPIHHQPLHIVLEDPNLEAQATTSGNKIFYNYQLEE